MDYDFRSRSGPQPPIYRPPPPPSPSPMYRPSPYQQNPTPSSGFGVRVGIKPEYRITPPPHLSSLAGDNPRSNFQFDFGLERKILAEAEKDNPNWSKFGSENVPTKVSDSSTAKVQEFVNGYTLLREMGFSSNSVADALVMNDNHTDKALAHFLNGSS
ncbi:uncharacterized protein LOC114410332 isoform X2 [Glycine soja]|uniref:uncharacterized protein LOC114410332 isoform X2 n=1 Tax=Glycine soja TaxID=3848 RepID=UPI001038FBDF|nr:uncharacterized protein LOC114410332 isoform X2 [Glycine soja]